MGRKSILIFLIFTAFSAASYSKPKVYYIDIKGEERETDWKISQSEYWKKLGKFKVLKKRSWIALPPLLELTNMTDEVSIVDNTEENGSPFVTEKNIKKVLVIEHINSTQITPLIKTAAVSERSKVGIKIQDLTFKPNIAITEACRKMDLDLDILESKPFIVSMDCRKKGDIIKILVGFSGSLKALEALGGEILSSQAGVNHIYLDYQKDRAMPSAAKDRFVASLFVEEEDGKKHEKYSVVFKPTKKTQKTVFIAENDTLKTVEKKVEASARRNTSFSYLTGLLSSKIGLEAYGSGKVFFNNKTQYLRAQISFPFNYLGNRNRDRSYLDSSLTYNWGFRAISVGAGVRLISLQSDDRRPFDYGPITGLNIRMGVDSLFQLSKDIIVGTAISYMPFAFDQYLKAQRLRWTIADISLFQSSRGRLSGLLYYDLLQIKEDPFEFNDYKFVGGVTYQW